MQASSNSHLQAIIHKLEGCLWKYVPFGLTAKCAVLTWADERGSAGGRCHLPHYHQIPAWVCGDQCLQCLQPHLPGEEVLTAGHKIKPYKQGAVGSTQGWALSDLGPLPDVLLGLQGFQKLFQACLEPCVLWALKKQNTNLFFVPLDNNFLSCHGWISLKSCVGCCRRGTGSVFCEGSRVWLFCSSYIIRNGWSFSLL